MTRAAVRGTGFQMSPSDTTFRIGVDENGLGSRLGPMIVTAVLARVTPEGSARAKTKARGALSSRLDDSKALVAHGDVALGEAWARAVVARDTTRSAPTTPDELVHALALDDRNALREPCPSHVAAQCWNTSGEAFEAEDVLVRTIDRDLAMLESRGIAVLGARSIIACPRRLNDALDQGKNRFQVDLHAMERLVLAFSDRAGSEVDAVCGKVGGFGKYGSAFGPLAGRLFVTLEESRQRSAYHFPGVGRLTFLQDADASDKLVAMASMIGKYLREALMGRIVRHYREAVVGLGTASGYHDPVTRAFVEQTELVRRDRQVPITCFERRGRVDARR
jgi:ribonuclease HII